MKTEEEIVKNINIIVSCLELKNMSDKELIRKLFTDNNIEIKKTLI